MSSPFFKSFPDVLSAKEISELVSNGAQNPYLPPKPTASDVDIKKRPSITNLETANKKTTFESFTINLDNRDTRESRILRRFGNNYEAESLPTTEFEREKVSSGAFSNSISRVTSNQLPNQMSSTANQKPAVNGALTTNHEKVTECTQNDAFRQAFSNIDKDSISNTVADGINALIKLELLNKDHSVGDDFLSKIKGRYMDIFMRHIEAKLLAFVGTFNIPLDKYEENFNFNLGNGVNVNIKPQDFVTVAINNLKPLINRDIFNIVPSFSNASIPFDEILY